MNTHNVSLEMVAERLRTLIPEAESVSVEYPGFILAEMPDGSEWIFGTANHYWGGGCQCSEQTINAFVTGIPGDHTDHILIAERLHAGFRAVTAEE